MVSGRGKNLKTKRCVALHPLQTGRWRSFRGQKKRYRDIQVGAKGRRPIDNSFFGHRTSDIEANRDHCETPYFMITGYCRGPIPKLLQKLELDEQIKRIAADPSTGAEKNGDPRGTSVYNFKIKTIQYLLAYRIVEEKPELIMIGPHQNYYRDLKKSLKST